MTQVTIEDSKLILKVEGLDKLWAFKSHLEIPLDHVSSVKADPETAQIWFKGIKVIGSDLPGVIKAGIFYEHEGRVFWDVHHPQKAISIGLKDERYKELIIEVEDPESTVATIQSAIEENHQ